MTIHASRNPDNGAGRRNRSIAARNSVDHARAIHQVPRFYLLSVIVEDSGNLVAQHVALQLRVGCASAERHRVAVATNAITKEGKENRGPSGVFRFGALGTVLFSIGP